MKQKLSLRLLGGVSLEIDNRPAKKLVSRKALALLAYLAHTRRAHARETLATLFWDDRSQAQAMGNLRVLLSGLRKKLGAFVTIERHTVSINFAADVQVDSVALMDTVLAAQQHHQREKYLPPTMSDTLETALALYAGDFLAGFHIRNSLGFEEWISLTREQVRHTALDGLYLLMTHYAQTENLPQAIACAERIIAIDPLQEAAHRAAMRFLTLNGQRNAAIRRYHACVAALKDELGVEPHPHTVALFDRILDMDTLPAFGLPPQPTAFIGREIECADIRRRLAADDCRLLTLTGPGGIGKTRLALETARRMRTVFLHGTVFVPLEQISTIDEVVPAIARAFQFVPDDDAYEESLWDFLREKELLLVLDNFEHLPDFAAKIVHQLIMEARLIKVLATSRRRLGLRAEWVSPMRGLPVPANDPAAVAASDAGQLFLQSAKRATAFSPTDDDFRAIGDICRLVNGLPLGLELAATWVRVFSCAEIAANIATDIDFLSASASDRPARHDSLRVVFNQSWALLGKNTRSALKMMTVFRAPFGFLAARAVANITAQQLAALVDDSFLMPQPNNNQFDMHPLLKQFVAGKLAESPELKATAQQRHALFYADFLRSQESILRGANAKQAETAIELAEENIRAAWDWAVEQRAEAVIAPAAESYYLYLWSRGRYHEGKRRLQQAAHAMHTAGKSALLVAQLRMFSAEFSAWLSEFEAVKKVLPECIAVFEAESAQREHSMAYDLLGRVAYWQGDFGTAAAHLEQATEAARQAESPFELAQALCALANAVCENAANYDRAKELYAESLALSRQLGNAHGVAKVTINLGALAQERGNLPEARVLFEDSLEQYRQLNYRHGISAALAYLGEISLAMEDITAARAFTEQSLALCRDAGDRQSMMGALVTLGRLNSQLNDFPQAKFFIRRAMRLALTLNAPQWAANSLLAWAELETAQGQPRQALVILNWLNRQSNSESELAQKIDAVLARVTAMADAAMQKACRAKAESADRQAIIALVLQD